MRHITSGLIVLCSLGVVAGIGCNTRPPTSEVLQPPTVTVDGLQQMKSKGGHHIFLKPGIDMNDYSSILVDRFTVSYTNPHEAPEAPVRTLDKETESRLTGLLRDVFIEEMGRSKGFEIVEEPGPEAVRVQGWLYDVVVGEPPRDDPRNFPLCFAEMRVILTLRHSETAQSLARVFDRVKLSCAAEEHARFHTARWTDVRGALKPWARFLRRWLEDLRELSPGPSALRLQDHDAVRSAAKD